MVTSLSFRLMFLIFLFASSVGLMVIGNVSKITQLQTGVSDAAALAGIVSLIAVSNTLGRVVGGALSDRIGRVNCLLLILVLQALNMLFFASYSSLSQLIVGVVLTGLCFGTILSVMPALCADLFGLKNFGMNYGVLFLSWGLAGVVTPVVADILFDATGSFNMAYQISCAMTAGMVLAALVLKRISGNRKA
jgi:MFS family permease